MRTAKLKPARIMEQIDHQPTLAKKAGQMYGKQSRHAMEESWITEHLPLVKHLVGKLACYAASDVEFEDLLSAGTLGLVKAAKSYDTESEATFKTYAYIRVRGAIIDEMRSKSFLPSNIHHEITRIEEVYRRLSSEIGHHPSEERLANEAGLSIEKLYETMEKARRRKCLSIYATENSEGGTEGFVPAAASPEPSDQIEKEELVEELAKVIMTLPERDRRILVLYYQRDLTMKQIGEVFEMTESRVSQLHAAALFKLTTKMGDKL